MDAKDEILEIIWPETGLHTKAVAPLREKDQLGDEDDVELTEEDTRTAFFSGTQLAIGDVLREQFLLALPMKALCRVDCKGLCPVCGANRNQNTCNCSGEVFSPHMEKLLEIKRKLEEERSS